ncbi:MAG: hypothetical protein OJF49_002339 [Ktedonobacterales bacterium]|nr:MAG: hypothetical protein OJF49_002339 [Ktedonobacterales bacterium]
MLGFQAYATRFQTKRYDAADSAPNSAKGGRSQHICHRPRVHTDAAWAIMLSARNLCYDVSLGIAEA